MPDESKRTRTVRVATYNIHRGRGLDGRTKLERIASVLAAGESYPSWQQAQQWLGLTRRGIRGIGLAPLTEIPEGSTPWAIETGEPVTAPDGEGPQLTRTVVEQEGDGESVADDPAASQAEAAPASDAPDAEVQ